MILTHFVSKISTPLLWFAEVNVRLNETTLQSHDFNVPTLTVFYRHYKLIIKQVVKLDSEQFLGSCLLYVAAWTHSSKSADVAANRRTCSLPVREQTGPPRSKNPQTSEKKTSSLCGRNRLWTMLITSSSWVVWRLETEVSGGKSLWFPWNIGCGSQHGSWIYNMDLQHGSQPKIRQDFPAQLLNNGGYSVLSMSHGI